MFLYLINLILIFFLLTRLFIQPFFITVITLILALNTSLMLALYMKNWYGLILMLIYVGGMLVMFFYVITISPNSLFNLIKMKDMFLLLTIMTLMNTVNLNSITPVIKSMFNSSNMMNEITSISSIIMMNNVIIYFALVILLLLILISIIKLCHKKSGSMRSFKL